MILSFFKFTKLPQLILAIIISLIIMAVIKNQNLTYNDFFSTITLILIFLLSIFIISKNSILKSNQFITLGLIIFSGTFIKMSYDFKITLSYLFLLLSIRKIYSLRSKKSLNKKFFDIGFWFSVSIFFHTINIFFFISILAGTVIFYKLDIKSLFKIIVGFIAALSFPLTYLLFDGKIDLNLNLFITNVEIIWNNLTTNKILLYSDFNHWFFGVAVALIFTLYSLKFFGHNLTDKLKNLFLFIFFLNSLAFIFLIKEYSILLFFPFLVTLVKIISILRNNLLFEIAILTIILLNSYPF